MANAKKNVTKKVATKKTSTRRVAKTQPITFAQAEETLNLSTMYTVSERKLLTWTPVMVFPTRSEAAQYASMMDEESGVSFNKYKVDPVLFTTKAVLGPSGENADIPLEF